MDESKILASMEWWHVAGGLILCGLTMFWAVYKLASMSLSGTTREFSKAMHEFSVRQAAHESRLEEYTRMIHQAQLSMIDRIARVEGRLQGRMGGDRWYDPESPA